MVTTFYPNLGQFDFFLPNKKKKDIEEQHLNHTPTIIPSPVYSSDSIQMIRNKMIKYIFFCYYYYFNFWRVKSLNENYFLGNYRTEKEKTALQFFFLNKKGNILVFYFSFKNNILLFFLFFLLLDKWPRHDYNRNDLSPSLSNLEYRWQRVFGVYSFSLFSERFTWGQIGKGETEKFFHFSLSLFFFS